MAGCATGDYEVDRKRHLDAAAKGMPEEIGRIDASRGVLHQLRDERLRELLAHATRHSAWHRERLAGLDLDAITGDDLGAIPSMTKTDLMENWDRIVCDPRLCLAEAEGHLERVAREGPAYLLDDYHALATGGSTGQRAVAVWDFEGFRVLGSRLSAWGLWLGAHLDMGLEPPLRIAGVGSSSPLHVGGAVSRCFANPGTMNSTTLPASLPIDRIVEALEEIQPQVLIGYASLLHEIAKRKLAGALDIEPKAISQSSEPFLPEAWAAVSEAFPSAVIRDMWGATELGMVASSYPGIDGLVVSEDLVILEPVDAAGRPVPIGQPADKVLATNLINRVLPLFRYEISDQLTMLPPAEACPWRGARISAIHGRLDDVFVYAGDRRVHPHAFRSVFTRYGEISEYQVRQNEWGASITAVMDSDANLAAIESDLVTALTEAGLTEPMVDVERTERITRHAESQKLKRFVPLSRPAV